MFTRLFRLAAALALFACVFQFLKEDEGASIEPRAPISDSKRIEKVYQNLYDRIAQYFAKYPSEAPPILRATFHDLMDKNGSPKGCIFTPRVGGFAQNRDMKKNLANFIGYVRKAKEFKYVSNGDILSLAGKVWVHLKNRLSSSFHTPA